MQMSYKKEMLILMVEIDDMDLSYRFPCNYLIHNLNLYKKQRKIPPTEHLERAFNIYFLPGLLNATS
ncbi:hypothetical protein RIR_jg11738.t1 [Rhizophagus irregularis DAOM 181602=DAOM 197198]|nr:hypothetical protein RIR_jg11738.t1 [Rhizophagus irregularis DAOM 181602=DAOM 197198]